MQTIQGFFKYVLYYSINNILATFWKELVIASIALGFVFVDVHGVEHFLASISHPDVNGTDPNGGDTPEPGAGTDPSAGGTNSFPTGDPGAAARIECVHDWQFYDISDDSAAGVACDFNLPAHVIEEGDRIAYCCNICYAIACSSCYVG